MSLGKPRSISAQKAPISNVAKQKRRYQRVHTDSEYNQMGESNHTSKHISRESVKRGRPWSSQVAKDPETIMQQNINLKMFINNLQEQLSLQRSRLEMNKRKNLKVVRQINREFQKQMYYSGKNPSGYLISGVKHQYDTMKDKYEQKCKAIDNILRSMENTSIEELKIYIQVLEGQNRVFRDQLQSYISITEGNPSINYENDNLKKQKHNKANANIERLYSQQSEDKSESSNFNLEVLASLLGQQRNNMKTAKALIQHLNVKIQRLNRTNSQLVKKVQFLEQLIIEKDNNEHEARRQFKRIQKQKLNQQLQIDRLNVTLSETDNLYKLKLKTLEERQVRKFQIQREIFEKSLIQKNISIQKLQKQIRFLSTMLSYWKPLDEINRQFQRQIENQPQSPIPIRQNTRSQRDDKYSISVKFRGNSQFNVRQSHKSEASLLGVDYPGKLQTEYEQSLKGNRQDDFPIKRTVTGNRVNSIQNVINVIKQRPRYNCEKRRSENAKKVRKVQINQIKHLGELIRYRLIGYNIDNETIKQYFNGSGENTLDVPQSKSQFITMREINQILRVAPFGLKEEEAVMVSRYIVEDSNNEYVYWDENNEISRNIAKSILKAFIGDYRQPNLESNRQEWGRLKVVYLNNIMSALNTIAPKGLVSLGKLNELLLGLGIDMSDELHDWMIGEMVINSVSLLELKYDIILEI